MLKFSIFSALLLSVFSVVFASSDALIYEEQTIVLNGESRLARIPKGYRLEFLAELDAPRMLTFAPNGDLLVGSKSGKIFHLAPPYTKAEVLVKLNQYPHSVAIRGNELLIAQTDGLYRANYQAGQAKIAANAVTLLAALPGGGGHNSRTVRVGRDGRIYLSLGVRGNCSDEYLGEAYPSENQRGGVLVLREAGGIASWETFASEIGRAHV